MEELLKVHLDHRWVVVNKIQAVVLVDLVPISQVVASEPEILLKQRHNLSPQEEPLVHKASLHTRIAVASEVSEAHLHNKTKVSAANQEAASAHNQEVASAASQEEEVSVHSHSNSHPPWAQCLRWLKTLIKIHLHMAAKMLPRALQTK